MKTIILSDTGFGLSIGMFIGFYVANLVAIYFMSTMPLWGVLGMTGMLLSTGILLLQQRKILLNK